MSENLALGRSATSAPLELWGIRPTCKPPRSLSLPPSLGVKMLMETLLLILCLSWILLWLHDVSFAGWKCAGVMLGHWQTCIQTQSSCACVCVCTCMWSQLWHHSTCSRRCWVATGRQTVTCKPNERCPCQTRFYWLLMKSELVYYQGTTCHVWFVTPGWNEFALLLLFHPRQMVVFKQDVCPAETPCWTVTFVCVCVERRCTVRFNLIATQPLALWHFLS